MFTNTLRQEKRPTYMITILGCLVLDLKSVTVPREVYRIVYTIWFKPDDLHIFLDTVAHLHHCLISPPALLGHVQLKTIGPHAPELLFPGTSP